MSETNVTEEKKYKCVQDCWFGEDPYGVKLYISGTFYPMNADHPCAIHFVDERGKFLKEPPKPERVQRIDEDRENEMLRMKIMELQDQILKAKQVEPEGDIEPKRGPGRPPKVN